MQPPLPLTALPPGQRRRRVKIQDNLLGGNDSTHAFDVAQALSGAEDGSEQIKCISKKRLAEEGRTHFKVKFKDGSAPEWLEESDARITPRLVSQFERRRARRDAQKLAATQEQQQQLSASPPPPPAVSGMEQESAQISQLDAMSVKQLRGLATELGVEVERIEDARDSHEPKAELIALINEARGQIQDGTDSA